MGGLLGGGGGSFGVASRPDLEPMERITRSMGSSVTAAWRDRVFERIEMERVFKVTAGLCVRAYMCVCVRASELPAKNAAGSAVLSSITQSTPPPLTHPHVPTHPIAASFALLSRKRRDG